MDPPSARFVYDVPEVLPIPTKNSPYCENSLHRVIDAEAVSSRRGKPFLRWAGSKRKQVTRLASFWTPEHKRYVEPFAGSACLFFELAPKAAVLGDTNSELIEVYRVVRDEPERLYRRLCRIGRNLTTYRRWRSINPRSLDR